MEHKNSLNSLIILAKIVINFGLLFNMIHFTPERNILKNNLTKQNIVISISMSGSVSFPIW